MAGTSRSSGGWSAWTGAGAVEAVGGWIVVQRSGGRDCAPGRLVEAARLTRSHDEALVSATRAINQLLDRVTAMNADAGRSLRFVVTPFGRALVWARTDAGTPTGATPEGDPAAFGRALGVSTEMQRAPGRYRDWVIDEEGNLICCRRGPNTQGVAELAGGGGMTDAHDATLAEHTRQINQVLETTAKQTPGTDRRLGLALLSTPAGLFLAWTINDDETTQNPPGAITAASDVATINRALGLARPAPAAGGLPWKFIVPVAAIAAGTAIVIAIAVALSSGDGDSSPAGVATGSPTARATAIATRVTQTPVSATELPAVASPTPPLEPTSPPAPTDDQPIPTSPVEPTSNLEPTRPPAPTATPNILPQT